MGDDKLIGLLLGESVTWFTVSPFLSGLRHPFHVPLSRCPYDFPSLPHHKPQITVPVSTKSEEVMGECQVAGEKSFASTCQPRSRQLAEVVVFGPHFSLLRPRWCVEFSPAFHRQKLWLRKFK